MHQIPSVFANKTVENAYTTICINCKTCLIFFNISSHNISPFSSWTWSWTAQCCWDTVREAGWLRSMPLSFPIKSCTLYIKWKHLSFKNWYNTRKYGRMEVNEISPQVRAVISLDGVKPVSRQPSDMIPRWRIFSLCGHQSYRWPIWLLPHD